MPSFSFNDTTPIAKATGNWNSSVPTYFNRAPANFSFPAFASLQVDTDSSYLPVKFTYLRANVYDLITLRLVGTGDWGKHTLPAKSFPVIQLPLNFTYLASNDTDATCMSPLQKIMSTVTKAGFAAGKSWYDACKNKALYVDGKRTRMFRLEYILLSLLTVLS